MSPDAQQLLDAVPEALMLVEQSGIIRFANQACQVLLELGADGAATRSFYELFDDAPPLVAGMRHASFGYPQRGPIVPIEIHVGGVSEITAGAFLVSLRVAHGTAAKPPGFGPMDVEGGNPAPEAAARLIDALPQALLAFDASQRVSAWNQQFDTTRPLGDLEVRVGMPLAEVFELLNGPRFVHESRVLGPLGDAINRVFDGESRAFEMRKDDRVLDVRGRPTADGGAVFTYTDLTDARYSSVLLRMLANGASIANEAQSVPDAVERCIENVCRDYRWVAGHAFLARADGDQLDLRSIGQPYVHDTDVARRYQDLATNFQVQRDSGPGAGAIWQVFENDEPMWFDDLQQFLHLPRSQVAIDSGIGCAVMVPIRTRSKVAGVLEVGGPGTAPYDALMVEVLLQLGAQIGRVIERHEANESLLEAHAAAEAAASAKAQFLANMSHEIRTPMNVILGFSELGLRQQDDTRLRGYLDRIHTASRSLLNLIDDALDLAKIEAGRIEIEQTAFALESVLEHIAGVLSLEAAEKPLEVIFYVPPNLPREVVGDPLRLQQILINLIHNAVKFTDAGLVSVSVSAERVDGDHVWFRFEVADTGVGIAPEETGQLFEIFSQVDPTNSRRFGGSGLGLAISKHLVGLMGGSIGVESEPGVGSQFWFNVPLAATLPSSVPPQSGTRLTAMVVAQHDATRDVLREYCTRIGYEVRAFSSCQLAHDWLVDFASDGRACTVALLETSLLPDGGTDAFRSGLQTAGVRDLPGLIVLADLKEGLEDASARQGPAPLLAKPVTPARLAEVLSAVGSGSRHVDAVANRVPLQDGIEALGGRVLVVEDNAMNRQFARELLENAGIAVEVAVDGPEALRLADAGCRYDLVLMDIQMPGMDGLSVTAALRAKPGFADLPIVAMTANVMPKDRERYLAAGMQDVVPKPVRRAHLFATLKRWMTRTS
ncbi:MAG: ATP-binding protein [Pseudomonadota bacterium]